MGVSASAWIAQQERAGVDWRRPAAVRVAVYAEQVDVSGRALVASPDVARRLAVCRACPRHQADGAWGKCAYSACSGCYMTDLRRGRAPEGCDRRDELERA